MVKLKLHMKKKIAILGSTGSIGKSLLKIIEKDKKNFEIILLTANEDFKTLNNQAKKFNVKNLIITKRKSYEILKKKNLKSKIKIYNSFKYLDKILKKKIDYVMSSIVGVEGLYPTIEVIKFTKKIAIANKESIICGWNLIKKELKKNKTSFIPVDSEHFSLWYGLNNLNPKNLEIIYITASGGPFYKTPLSKFKNLSVARAIKHPNWKMGKKISVDSATMMNKVYEVIEAKNIFDFDYKNIKIIIHPKSYVHALLKFNNGMIKIIAHETTMKIPIFNTIHPDYSKAIKSKKINLNNLNNLSFEEINYRRYPMVKLLKLLPKKHSLFETVIVSANDVFVKLFLENKIKFIDIQKNLFSLIKRHEFKKYKKIIPKNIKDIIELNDYVSSKILKTVYKIENEK